MRVVADIGDAILQVLKFGLGFNDIVLIQKGRAIAAIALRYDGDNCLARKIASNEDNMGFIYIHFDGIEQLTIGAICSVQVGTHITAKMLCHVLSSYRGKM